MPAVCVNRSRIVIGRFAAASVIPVPFSFRLPTVVWSNVEIHLPAFSLTVSLPSSMSCRIATLVSAFDCDAMRNCVSIVILRPASLSLQPTARSYTGLPSRSTSATTPFRRPSFT